MIPDHDCDTLFLADTLEKKYPDFFRSFTYLLSDLQIEVKILQGTKDVWAVDYMPIQVAGGHFVGFEYLPDYLNSKKWVKTRTNYKDIWPLPQKWLTHSPIVLDGGNVVKANNKVMMCDKIFRENPDMPEDQLSHFLKQLLQVDKIIWLPTHPKDLFGHADGVARFCNSQLVLVNDWRNEPDDAYHLSLRTAIRNAGYEVLALPYNPYQNSNIHDATGTYINYLECGKHIIMPIYNIPEDEAALLLMTDMFPNSKVSAINCAEIAKQGGVLNCISWKVLL